MEYTKLGKSDLVVSRICLGCMSFGDSSIGHHRWALDEQQSDSILEAALRGGINFFDTAIGYQGGTSEQYLGSALKRLVPREKVVVATKFLPRTEDEIVEGVSGAEHVRRNLETSLENLGMDYVDLYICHMWDYNTPVLEILEGMNEALEKGMIRALGISNCFAWQLCYANAEAQRAGLKGFVSVQNHYNLLFREEEREMAELCRTEEIAMTPYSPLASGRLSRKPGSKTTKRLDEDSIAKSKYDRAAELDAPIVARVSELADRHGVSMTEVAIAWLLTKVTAPVVGATKPSQIETACQAVQLRLTVEEQEYLEEPYVPHELVGVMEVNVPKGGSHPLIWPAADPNLKT